MTRGGPTRVDTTLLQRSRAKAMRRDMTEPERALWRALRVRLPIEATHFRRQVAIGPYIADFCAFGAKLVVEVDGEQHGFDDRRTHDERRTRYLAGLGYRVLRFTNRQVRFELDSVLDTIFAAVAETPTPSPSPQGGGGRPQRSALAPTSMPEM